MSSSTTKKPPIPFCTSSNIALVPIHPDLINEPFRKVDTGVRPDVFTSGPFFHLRCSRTKMNCRAGGLSLNLDGRFKVKEKWKLESFLSVSDVYETYGLEMVYSYLHRTYHSKLSVRFSELLSTYLLGSLALVNEELAQELSTTSVAVVWMRILLVIAALLAEFTGRELRQPMLSSPLVPLDQTLSDRLPIEILARIFNSKRISKQIAEQVTLQRASRPLRLGEINARAIYEPVCYSAEYNVWIMNLGDRAWMLACEEGIYKLALLLDVEGLSFPVTQPVLYSYRDYARLRHTDDVLGILIGMLATQEDMEAKRIESTTPEQLEEKVCRWIVLLASELNDCELPKKIACTFTKDKLKEMYFYLLNRVVDELKSAATVEKERTLS